MAVEQVRVALHKRLDRYVPVEPGATRGATIGTNVYNPDGSLFEVPTVVTPTTDAGAGVGGISMTLWSLIQEIPTPVSDVAALSYTGNGLKVIRLNAGETALEFANPGAVWGFITGTLADQTDLQAALDAKASQAYVDAAINGRSWKTAVRAGTTVAGTLATSFENGDTIDGVVLATGDRILIKNQAAAAENGIYIVNASGAPTRATDADTGAELVDASMYVSEGTTLADQQWTCTTNAPITIGVTSLTFVQSGAGTTYTADGTTLDLTGTQFSVKNAGVTNAKLANMAAHTIKANITGSSASPVDSGLSAILDAEIGATNGMMIIRSGGSWVSLLYPNDATKFLDGTLAFSNPAATGGAGYAVALDLDFTAESSQTLSSDTTYSIGGVTWTKVNSAADSVSMAVTAGTGLVIQPVQTSNYNGTSRTAPYLYLDMATLIPAFYHGMPLRISIYVSADNIAASGHSCGWSLDNLSTSTNTTSVYTARRANNSGTKSIELGGIMTGTTITFTANSSNLDNTDRVIVVDIPSGRLIGQAGVYSGAYSSGFPALSAMQPRSRVPGGNSSFTLSQDVVASLPMKFVLFAQRNGSATALSVTIARIKIEYRNS